MRALPLLLLALVLSGCDYNRLVQLDEQVNRAQADLESQYQRRLDLIPNLVATVQGAAEFERGTQTEIAELRAQAAQAQQRYLAAASVEEQQAAAAQAEAVLTRFFAVMENYPQLRATESFRDLQAQLEGTENRIAVARRDYNQAVAAYNAAVRRFPTVVYARALGFGPRSPFEAAPGAEQAPRVQF